MLGPFQDVDFKLRDYKLFNSRPVPVGYDVAYCHHDLKTFLGYCDSKAIKKREIVSSCNFDNLKSSNGLLGVIAMYTDFLPDNFRIELTGNIFDKDTEDFEINMGCITEGSSQRKPSQRLVLLEGDLPSESIDSILDIDLTLHYENWSWDNQYFPSGTFSSIRPIIAPRRILKPENVVTRALGLVSHSKRG